MGRRGWRQARRHLTSVAAADAGAGAGGAGGAGGGVAEALFKHKLTPNLIQLGLPDEFIMQGTQQEMYAELGLDTKGILAAVAANS